MSNGETVENIDKFVGCNVFVCRTDDSGVGQKARKDVWGIEIIQYYILTPVVFFLNSSCRSFSLPYKSLTFQTPTSIKLGLIVLFLALVDESEGLGWKRE